VAEDDVNPDNDSVTVRLSWPGDTDVPALPANQFLVSVGLPDRTGAPDGIYLVVGHAAPPVLHGADDLKHHLRTYGISVKVHGRYLLSRERLGELIDVLAIVAERYDKAQTQRQEGGGS